MKRLTGTDQQMARMQRLQPTEPGIVVKVGGNEIRIVPGGWPAHCEPAEHKGKYVTRLFTLYHEYTDSGVDPIVLEPDEVGEFVQRIVLTAELPEVWQEAIGPDRGRPRLPPDRDVRAMSYPLKCVPRHPGPRPPWYRFRARNDWRLIMRSRRNAKEWNFGALYGAICADVEKYEPISVDEARTLIDMYFMCDERHTQTHDPVVR